MLLSCPIAMAEKNNWEHAIKTMAVKNLFLIMAILLCGTN
jgi:hypothetical protein